MLVVVFIMMSTVCIVLFYGFCVISISAFNSSNRYSLVLDGVGNAFLDTILCVSAKFIKLTKVPFPFLTPF